MSVKKCISKSTDVAAWQGKLAMRDEEQAKHSW